MGNDLNKIGSAQSVTQFPILSIEYKCAGTHDKRYTVRSDISTAKYCGIAHGWICGWKIVKANLSNERLPAPESLLHCQDCSFADLELESS